MVDYLLTFFRSIPKKELREKERFADKVLELEKRKNFFEEDRHRLDYSYRSFFSILTLDSYVGSYKYDL